MKGIKLCGECGNYDYKKHRCRIGCKDDSNAQAYFYGDCPLPDVVPKSEYEQVQEEANRYKRYFFRHDYDEMIAEVLDELDGFIKSNCIEIKDERGIKGYVTSSVHFAIADLKKKYTEGQE